MAENISKKTLKTMFRHFKCLSEYIPGLARTSKLVIILVYVWYKFQKNKPL